MLPETMTMRQASAKSRTSRHLGTFLLTVAMVVPSTLHAQRIRMSAPTVFLPAPRELQRELDLARRDVSQERFVDAITRLDLILLGGDDEETSEFAEDYFLPAQGEALRSLKLEAERVLAELPAAGREAYELSHGTDARQLLNDAISKRDFDQISEIARRYANTVAGQEAIMLMGRECLASGQTLQAVMHFQRLADSETAMERFGGEVPLLLATALKASQREGAARDVLDRFWAKSKAANVDPQVEVGGTNTEWFDEDGQALAWLDQQIGDFVVGGGEVVKDWPVFGGNARRAAVTAAEMPIRRIRWDLPVAIKLGGQAGDEPQMLELQARKVREAAVTPALHPLVVGNWVLMRSTDHLLGVDLESGIRVWRYPWAQGPAAAIGTSQQSRRSSMVKTRIWQDALYGQISSDGKSVFLLDDIHGQYYSQRGRGISNKLLALDLEKEGYLVWSVGGAEVDSEPELAGVFFLGAPLPVGQELFCVGELNGEIRLFALDASSGKLLWSQQLAHIDVRPGLDNGTQRRMAGLNLSYANGILVCPTSVGGTVAVDVARRTFRWGFQYIKTGQRRSYGGARTRGEVADHWRDNSLLIADGKVVITPWDSGEMYCRDLLTGKAVWTKPKPRGNSIFAAGIHDDKVIVVGKSDVRALDLESGEEVWKLELNCAPSGRGVQAGARYLLATTKSELLEIDLEIGRVLKRLSTDEPLGNLVVANGHIISQNHHKLRAFYQRPTLEKKIRESLARSPDDAWALEHRAILHLEDGRMEDALRDLRRALAIYPDDEDSGENIAARQLLVTTGLAMLRKNMPGALELAKEIEPFVSEREFARVMAQRLRREGEVIEAVKRHFELFRDDLVSERDAIVRDSTPRIDLGADLNLRQDRWQRAQFRGLWLEANESQRAAIRALGLKALKSTTALADRWRLVELLQDLPFAQPSHLELLAADIKNESGSAVTEMRLLRLADAENPELAAQAVALLGALYQRRDRPEAAAAAYRRLQTEFADVLAVDGRTGKQVVRAAAESDERLRQDLVGTGLWNWSFGNVRVSAAKPPTRVAGVAVMPPDHMMYTERIDFERPYGRSPTGLELVVSGQTNRMLIGRDGMGNDRFVASLATTFPSLQRSGVRLRTNGHFIVAARGNKVAAINALAADDGSEESIMWQDVGPDGERSRTVGVQRKPIGQLGQLKHSIEDSPNGRTPMSLGPMTADGLVIRRYSDLMCLDPTSGEPVWTRSDVDMNATVWGDGEQVFVHTPATGNRTARQLGKDEGQRFNVRVFSMLDGTELASRPVAEQPQRIRTFGSKVLSWSYGLSGGFPSDPRQVLIQLLESELQAVRNTSKPLEGQDALNYDIQLTDISTGGPLIWQRSFSFGSRATMVSESELAVYDPATRRIQIVSIGTGEEIVDYEVDESIGKVDSINAERRAGVYVITLGQSSTGRKAGKVVYKSPDTPLQKLSHLTVFAFNPEGEMVWGVPARFRDFVKARFYAPDVPVLLFIRHDESGAKKALQSVVLDVRDGHVIHTASELAESGQLGKRLQVSGDLEENVVNILLPCENGRLKLEFTDEPRAPSPPYGYASPTKRGNSSLFGKAFEVLRNVFSEDEPAAEGDGEELKEDLEDLFR